MQRQQDFNWRRAERVAQRHVRPEMSFGKGFLMQKILTICVAALLCAGVTISVASAEKSRRHNSTQSASSGQGTTPGAARPYTGGNAALKGNNGNSAQGDNSLGNIKGGNIGGGK
jgi:hypothetical protein